MHIADQLFVFLQTNMKISVEKVIKLFTSPPGRSGKLEDISLYNRVFQGLRRAILSGDLPFNCELPPTRQLADAMNISRSTIIKSYELLRLEGLISSKIGSGSVVTYQIEESTQNKLTVTSAEFPEISETGRAFYNNRNLVNPLDDSYISFRPGLPPLDVFPVEQWKKQLNRYWSMIRASELTYHSAMGMDSLRMSLANHLNIHRNIKCDYRQIVIVGGSLQSLFLIGNLILDRGDGVYLEEQTFPNIHSVFKGLRASLHAVPLDKEGIAIQHIAANDAPSMKLIHTTPSCQYPMGMQMSLKRRQDLVSIARQKNLYIIENDYEHDVNRFRDPLNSIYSTDPDGRTFYVGTFNRILHPSVRVGFMIVPKHLITPMESLIRHSHMFISPSIQMVMRSFLENKTLHKHIDRVNKAVGERRDIFAKSMSEISNPKVEAELFRVPSLHMLIHLDRQISDIDVVNRLKQQGVLVHPLSKCAVGDEKRNGLIVGYASTRTQLMKPKLKILLDELNAL